SVRFLDWKGTGWFQVSRLVRRNGSDRLQFGVVSDGNGYGKVADCRLAHRGAHVVGMYVECGLVHLHRCWRQVYRYGNRLDELLRQYHRRNCSPEYRLDCGALRMAKRHI